jgi:hypothetical protein
MQAAQNQQIGQRKAKGGKDRFQSILTGGSRQSQGETHRAHGKENASVLEQLVGVSDQIKQFPSFRRGWMMGATVFIRPL